VKEQLKILDAFEGKWNTEGKVYDSPYGPASEITGIDTYEWLPGGYFLIHNVNVLIGGVNSIAIEIIGYDTLNNNYFMHSYDNQGNNIIMQASINNKNLIFTGEKIRYKGKFSDDGMSITGNWEYLDDDLNWKLWMDIKLTKKVKKN